MPSIPLVSPLDYYWVSNNFGKRKSRLGGGIFCKKDAGAISADLGSSILPSVCGS